MWKRLVAVGLAVGLGGCAATGDSAWWRAFAGLEAPVGAYHFDWRLSGDPGLAPLQVFDDGQDTWLQYPQGQAVPALFARTAAGDRLLTPRREGDYLVVRGVPGHLVMRGGLLQAEAQRVSTVGQADGAAGVHDATAAVAAAVAVAAPPTPEVGGFAALPAAPIAAPVSGAAPSPGRLPVAGRAGSDLPAASRADGVVAGSQAGGGAAMRGGRTGEGAASEAAVGRVHPPAARLESFEVTPADGNVRRALGRWARQAGWTFDTEHWAVDVDIPLAGSAVFQEPFRAAVRGLLAATELGDRPLQPCFYNNRVLRVVPLAQRCDRTQAAGAES
ncbi:TcpQ domain-containing protein [Castellaniella caeni]